jgi:hypothetical protein
MSGDSEKLAAILEAAKDAKTIAARLSLRDIVLEVCKENRITTAEELDALPEWSVVLSDTYRHHASGQRLSFQRWDDGAWHRGGRSASTHPDNFLPATVLHVGGGA